MIGGYAVDDAGKRLLDHIGGIQPAAETDFQNGEIGGMFCEGVKRRRRRSLEIGDGSMPRKLAAFAQNVGQLFLAYQLPGNANTLMKAHKMRRGINMDLVSCCLQNGS